MIEPETAEEATKVISSAIAELFEDVHETAISMQDTDLIAMARRAQILRSAGEDVITLAAAIEVFARRGSTLADFA